MPLAAAVAAVAVLTFVTDASAATVAVSVDETSENVPKDRGFSFSAAPGERNDVVLVVRAGRLEVRDRGAGLTAGEGCRADPGGVVSCSQARVDFWSVELADGDDVLVVESRLVNTRYVGGPGDDTITGSSGYESFSGGPGSDSLRGRGGVDLFSEDERAEASLEPDVYDGGSGPDEITYGGRSTGITVDLAAGTGPEGDRVIGIESLVGGSGDDVILGNDAPGRLQGAAGDDRVEGRGGDDKLYGGEGSDVLLGGAGNDQIMGQETFPPDGADRVHGGPGDDFVVADARDELSCGAGRDRRYSSEPQTTPVDCEELYALASGPRMRGVAIGARPGRAGRRLSFRVRCLRVLVTGADLPEPVRDASCRARLELRAYRAGRRNPGRLLARSRRARLPPGGGRLSTPGVRPRRVWAVVVFGDGYARIALRHPRGFRP